MSGKRYLLDTNAVVSLLSGNTKLGTLLRDASWVGISVITQLEFLAFPELAEKAILITADAEFSRVTRLHQFVP